MNSYRYRPACSMKHVVCNFVRSVLSSEPLPTCCTSLRARFCGSGPSSSFGFVHVPDATRGHEDSRTVRALLIALFRFRIVVIVPLSTSRWRSVVLTSHLRSFQPFSVNHQPFTSFLSFYLSCPNASGVNWAKK